MLNIKLAPATGQFTLAQQLETEGRQYRSGYWSQPRKSLAHHQLPVKPCVDFTLEGFFSILNIQDIPCSELMRCCEAHFVTFGQNLANCLRIPSLYAKQTGRWLQLYVHHAFMCVKCYQTSHLILYKNGCLSKCPTIPLDLHPCWQCFHLTSQPASS